MTSKLKASAFRVAGGLDLSLNPNKVHNLIASKENKTPKEDRGLGSGDDIGYDDDLNDLNEVFDKITAKDLDSSKFLKPLQDDYIDRSVMIEAIEEVEERLKERRLNTITINSISVSKLPLVNKFNKNEPWLKVTYGSSRTWNSAVSIITDERGTTAEWDELNYEFILPRNQEDRGDLTVAICSQKIVLGRYVLQAKNFVKIPKMEESEYFEVKGKITNSLGKAGRIIMICRHGKADAPGQKTADYHPENKIVYAPKHNMKVNFNDIDKVYVKILSIVLVDMPQINSFEDNSPMVTVSCGSWEKKTNIEYDSGSEAKWTKLYWKLILGKLDVLSFTISSNPNGRSDFIGTVGVAIDDLMPDKIGSDGIVIIVRYMTNGKAITGKIRIRLQIRYPTDIAMKLSSAATNAADIQRRNSQLILQSPRDGNGSNGIGGLGSSSTSRSNLGGTGAAAYSLTGNKTISSKLETRVIVTSTPFKLTITSITAVDLKPRHTLFANSPYINAVYGSWGQGTEVVNGAGACAHWLNLNWQVVINDENHLELNAWSRGSAIGKIELTPKFLLSQVIDKNGNVTLLLKLIDENEVTSGKLKVTCTYNQDISDMGVITDLQKLKATEEMVNLGLFFTNHITKIELPASAKVIGVSALDLINVHYTRPNNPRVKLSCDRQVAATTVASRAGSQSQWIGMDWKFDIHQGSFLILTVTSEDKLIGSLELSAKSLVAIPPNDKGITEVSCPITSTSGAITGRIKLSLKLSSLAMTFAPPMIAGRHPISPHADTKGFFNNESHASVASLIQNKLFLLIELNRIEILDYKSKPFPIISSNSSISKGVWVSLSYGRYHETTQEQAVLPPVGTTPAPIEWNGLSWHFKVKEEYSLRLVLHSNDGTMLGLVSISPQTLFSNHGLDQDEETCQLLESIYNENVMIAKIKFTYKKMVMKDWCNDFKSIEQGSNGYKTANRNAMMGQLSKNESNVNIGVAATGANILPPIFEGDGVGNIEEDDDEDKAFDDDDDIEFPIIASMKSILLTKFNFNYISLLSSQSKKPPMTPQSSSPLGITDWLSKNIFGIALLSSDSSNTVIINATNTNTIGSPTFGPTSANLSILRSLPIDSKLSVRFEISNNGSSSSNGNNMGSMGSNANSNLITNLSSKNNINNNNSNAMINRGNKWSYETSRVSCDELGLSVSIDDDVKLPLLSMHTEIIITVYLILPYHTTALSSSSSTAITQGNNTVVPITLSKEIIALAGNPITHILGTTIIMAEDLADIPKNNFQTTEICRSISKGGSATANITLFCKLRPTTLENLYTQHYQISRNVTAKVSTSASNSVPTSQRNIQFPIINRTSNSNLIGNSNNSDLSESAVQSIQTKHDLIQNMNKFDSNTNENENDDQIDTSAILHPIKDYHHCSQPDTVSFATSNSNSIPIISTILYPTISPNQIHNQSKGGVVRSGKPYQFDIATDENAIGKLFSNRSSPIPPTIQDRSDSENFGIDAIHGLSAGGIEDDNNSIFTNTDHIIPTDNPMNNNRPKSRPTSQSMSRPTSQPATSDIMFHSRDTMPNNTSKAQTIATYQKMLSIHNFSYKDNGNNNIIPIEESKGGSISMSNERSLEENRTYEDLQRRVSYKDRRNDSWARNGNYGNNNNNSNAPFYDDESDLVSINEYNRRVPEVNYFVQAKHRQLSQLISGTKLFEQDNNDNEDNDNGNNNGLTSSNEDRMIGIESPIRESHGIESNIQGNNDNLTGRRGSNAPSRIQQQLQTYQIQDGVLFEKIKLSGYTVTIKNLMVIDLITAHRLKSNSPAIALICEDTVYNTSILEDSGTVGIWTGLDWQALIHRDNDISLTVSSRGKIIGSVVFTLKQLLKAAESNDMYTSASPFKKTMSVTKGLTKSKSFRSDSWIGGSPSKESPMKSPNNLSADSPYDAYETKYYDKESELVTLTE